jgi:glycine C-acetyltransferase
MVDYLGLSQDPRLKAAAIEAIETFGLHLPSSGPLMGNTEASYGLERAIARLLGRQDAFLLPTGWAAGFAAVSGVVRPGDHVLMDELSHQCLQQGAYASTAQVSVFRHLDNGHLESQLVELRAKDPASAILIITEGLFSMDGDTPNLREVVALARRFGAQTLVDIAHDFGCTGPSGTGTLGAQEVMNDIDIVVGSFSKSFGTNGGFISSRTLSMQWAQLCFAGPYTFSTCISPVQVAAAAAALDIVTSSEGDSMRATLQARVAHAREAAASRGLTVIGAPSPIVPVLIGREQHSRLAGLYSFRRGLIATCLEFPVVQRGAARYRLSMSPRLSLEQIDTAMDIVAESIADAKRAID